MRVIIGVILAAFLGYAGYWVVASRMVTGQIDQVLAVSDRVSARDVQLAGFPYRFDLRASDVGVASADQATTWRAPEVTVTALSYRPHHLIAFVTGQQAVTWRGVPMVVTADATRTSLVLTPGTALAVARANLVLDAPVLQLSSTTHRADTLRAALRGENTTHDLALEVSALTPDPTLVAMLDPTGSLPPLVARIGLDARVLLDRTLALRGPMARVQGIDLRALSLEWGALSVAATGTLQVDGPGTLGGQVTLDVTGWPLLLDALARGGVIAPDMVGMARQMAASMANPATGALTLLLSVRGSNVALGPFVLGQLPRF